MQRGDAVTPALAEPVRHWTKPAGRLTEGTLVKALEEAGVGRPSTYAPIIRVLLAMPRPQPASPVLAFACAGAHVHK